MATISILIKSLRPRPMNVKGYRDIILKQLKNEGKQMRLLYEKVDNSWSKPVRFRTDLRVAGNDAEVRISTKDIRFISLDLGTKTRWAVMSNPFKPKTQVRKLRSFRGQGKPIIRGKQAMQARGISPRPGIKARGWSIEVRKLRRPIFFRNMRRAMKRAARGTF